MTMCSSGWSVAQRKYVCIDMYSLRKDGCGEKCFITCWRSHGACRGRSARQVDCFGSRSASLTSAKLQSRPEKNNRTGARFDVLAPPGDWLATLAATEGESFEEDVTEFLATHPVAGDACCSDWSDALRDKRSICIAVSGARRRPSSSSDAQDRTTSGIREVQPGGATCP